MKVTKKTGLIFATIIFSVAFLWLATPKNANADSASIEKKWLFTLYHQCLVGGDLQTTIERKNSGELAKSIFADGSSDQYLPSEDYLGKGTETISCRQVLQGTGGLNGIFSYGGISPNISWAPNSNEILSKIGYTFDQKDEYSFNISVKIVGKSFTDVNGIGRQYDSQSPEEKVGESLTIKASRQSNGTLVYTRDGGSIRNSFAEVKVGFNSSAHTMVVTLSSGDDAKSFSIPLQNDINAFYNNLNQTLVNNGVVLDKISEQDVDNNNVTVFKSGIEYTYQFEAGQILTTGEGETFTYPSNRSSAADASIANFGGTHMSLSEDETYELYLYYLNMAISGGLSTRFSCEDEGNLTEIHLKDSNGVYRKYYANLNMSDTSKQYAVQSGKTIVKKDLNYIISWFNSHPATAMSDEQMENCEVPSEGTTRDDYNNTSGDSGLDIQECFNGADALGWILCPIIKIIHAAVETIYSEIVEPFLTINVSAFDLDNGVYQGWQIFQGFANIIFVILFLFVIFSQITGIGIDNYGIKRILPKLIVTAILINLSYIICQLLVDASNILGVGLRNLFESIQISGASVSTGQQALTTAITGMIAGMGGAAAVATSGMWLPALIPPLLLALFTTLISVIFMFILLGIRQAGVIILVVISPVAFVLYMLPNTKPLFDRWRKMFEGLLMLFPICGAMIGGCALASEILNASGTSFWISLLAALLTVVPFFFVPKLLKGSFAAMGNIGGKISALGSGLGRRAGGAVAGSQAVKDMTNRMGAGVNAKGETTMLGRMRDKVASGKSIYSKIPGMQRAASRSAARGRAAYYKDQAEQRHEAQLNDPSYRAAYEARQNAEFLNDQVATEQALIEANSDFAGGNYDKVASDMVGWMQAGGEDNAVKVRAAMNALNKIGDDGRTAIDKALSANGGVDFTSMPLETRQAFASQAMNNYAGEWKNNARSLYEAAKSNTGSSGSGNYNDFVPGGTSAAKVSSYRQEQFANMDDGQFAHIMSDVQNLQAKQSAGTISSDESARLEAWQNLAYETANNENLEGAMKGQRGADIRSIAGGYTPNNVLRVQHEDDASRRGRQTVTFGYNDVAGKYHSGESAELYVAPSDLGGPVEKGQRAIGGYSKDTNGDFIYTRKIIEQGTGKVVRSQKWNATTGKYKK